VPGAAQRFSNFGRLGLDGLPAFGTVKQIEGFALDLMSSARRFLPLRLEHDILFGAAMASPSNNDDLSAANPHQFAETRWSLVMTAGEKTSAQSMVALETLCRTYWYPLYAYVRRKGNGAHDAQDLVQGFFARLLKNKSFAAADRRRGKFRTYLLGAMNHFLADEWDKMRAQKRGGGEAVLSLDTDEAERRYLQEPSSDLTPDKIYDRRWGRALLDEALTQLGDEFSAAGRARHFELLKSFLVSEAAAAAYDDIAAELQTTPNAVAASVRRLRQRYRNLVRAEVAQTVNSPSEIDQELRALFG
jgi:RNA polymerase sigma factor (sigma-70 family)